MSALLETYIEMAGPNACDSEKGFLALVDAQTGLGKTYQATALQLEHLISDSKKTLIYSTNLRVNVKEAYQDLLERIKHDEFLNETQKKNLISNVILIPAQDSCIRALSEEDWATIFEVLEVQQRREIKSLRDKIALLTGAQDNISAAAFEDELREYCGKIYTLLRSCFRGKGRMSPSVETVLDKVFPARLIDEEQTQALFLTTSKLLYPWHGIERTYRISDFLENSLLILDEFDRQQSEFLTHLINTVSDYDIIALTRKFYSSFDSFKIQGAPEFNGVDKCFDHFRIALKDYKQKWKIYYRPFITNATIQKGSENQNRIFTLLSDRMSIHAINFKHEDLRSNINHLKGSHEIGPNGKESTIQFVNNGAQLVRTFCNGMLSAILTLKKNLEESNDPRSYTTENLVEKILNNLGLVELTKSIMSLISARLSFKVQNEYKSYSFHDSGYEIANISKFSETDNTAIASTFDLALTSTGLLAHWVLAGAKVLGISATATSETAIHNFDLKYLEDVLSDRLIVLNESQKSAIQSEYYAKRRYAENGINIYVTGISQRVDWGGVSLLYQEFKETTYFPQLLEIELCQLLGVDKSENLSFELSRADKLIDSIKRFSEHPSNRYHFCMLNKSYKNREFFEFMVFIGQKFDVEIFENINAASFRNEQFQGVLELLEGTNKKVAVITNYQATGAGLSPSYEVPNGHDLVYVGPKGSEPIQNKTDIDSIYLEQPKSLIGSHLHDNLSTTERELAIKKNIHDALMLHEKGIIVANEVKGQLKWFISPKANGKAVGSMIKIYKGSEDYRYAVYRFIEQALGRMCRTEWKQKEISIMYDAEADFIETLAKDSRDLSYLSYEYQELITEVKKKYKVFAEEKQRISYHPKASRNYAHIQRLITSVYEHQNPNAIGQYERLRLWMLKKPAMDNAPVGEEVRYYIEPNENLGRYQYQINYSEEKGITEIFVDPADVAGLREVSEVSARLPILLKNPLVAAHFNDNHFSSSFSDGKYVLAPAMFDLYMGAVGEEAVTAVLNHFKYEMQGMPKGSVERFDGYLAVGNRILLVDVKHWDLRIGCLIYDNTLQKCQAKLLEIKNNPPKEFQDKVIQALYINTIYDGKSEVATRKFSEAKEMFVEYAIAADADVIEIPGIIDSVTGTNNVPPMDQLLELLNQFSE
ncbi:hypothetical protein [Vibrio parahaemolyticus]|uniref:hypothetical protein n=1 Tax=Vibrio parahaemolyticus TaxID=670 RepID=UPI00112276E5|nr:hypothetical protein [Vibrio parahaemolyticus]MCZ6385256.1 hypothetical protein [Vibrio parahaemolyticus]MDF4862352.1 hypothetical protein [Vibrio parahaemolyticus]MRD97069.1 hypothetical protein [Vibrio parahaemolyticus]QNE56894.1 hypothetical protein H5404_13530 [Vibrio parahaemolyticus]TNZ07183.1 hypothetical protein CGK56_01435 [Vibrio parahaemolyticus]